MAALSHLLQIGNRANSDLTRDYALLPPIRQATATVIISSHILPPSVVALPMTTAGAGHCHVTILGPEFTTEYRVQYDGGQANMAERERERSFIYL